MHISLINLSREMFFNICNYKSSLGSRVQIYIQEQLLAFHTPFNPLKRLFNKLNPGIARPTCLRKRSTLSILVVPTEIVKKLPKEKQ